MIPYPFPIPTESPFGLANLPFGIFSTKKKPSPRPGMAVGNYILDLQALVKYGLEVSQDMEVALSSVASLTPNLRLACLIKMVDKSSLNALAALPLSDRKGLRQAIQTALRDPSSQLYIQRAPKDMEVVIPQVKATMHKPMKIGGFTDFMCSLEHVQTVGRFAGHSEVPQNFFNLPMAYNGRASSIIISGQSFRRPWGVIPSPDGPKYLPSQKLDYEVEMGVFVSKPVAYGQTISASKAREHIFGLVLLNDWSARDIQFYEMTPLGPLNGKATGTSISPWIVTLEALEEAGAIIPVEPSDLVGGKATSLPFLRCHEDLAIQVSSYISRNDGRTKELIGKSNLKHLHWSPFQMLAHQSSSGCGLETGDLIGTGTISSTEGQILEFGSSHDPARRAGCLQELVQAGKRPLQLADGSELVWINDGDVVIFEGWAGSSEQMIGFGELSTQVICSTDSL